MQANWNNRFLKIIAIKSYSLHPIFQQSSIPKPAQTDNFLIQTVDIVIGQFFMFRERHALPKPTKWGMRTEILSYFANGLHGPWGKVRASRLPKRVRRGMERRRMGNEGRG